MNIFKSLFGFGDLARNLGGAIRENVEVFHPNQTQEMQANAERFQKSIGQFEAEFQFSSKSFFGKFVDALNRLPRPAMALGTIFLFTYAMWNPSKFSIRMQGLQNVPEPLWWLMGAVVSFYFGAREMHYFRSRKVMNVTGSRSLVVPEPKIKRAPKPAKKDQPKIELPKSTPNKPTPNKPTPNQVRPGGNAAIEDYLKSQ